MEINHLVNGDRLINSRKTYHHKNGKFQNYFDFLRSCQPSVGFTSNIYFDLFMNVYALYEKIWRISHIADYKTESYYEEFEKIREFANERYFVPLDGSNPRALNRFIAEVKNGEWDERILKSWADQSKAYDDIPSPIYSYIETLMDLVLDFMIELPEEEIFTFTLQEIRIDTHEKIIYINEHKDGLFIKRCKYVYTEDIINFIGKLVWEEAYSVIRKEQNQHLKNKNKRRFFLWRKK